MSYPALSAVLAVLVSSAALAGPFDQPDRWRQIASTETGSVWYLDRATLKQDGLVTSAWLDMDHSRDKTEPARQTRALISIECAAHRYRWVQFFQYRANGSPLPQRVPPNVGMDIEPGSPIEQVSQGMCQAGGP